MLNVIRTTPGRIKYCGRTVDNLISSNGKEDHQILICCSGNRTANDNGIETLRAGIAASDGKPFCFLEDDLNFIAQFNRSAEDFVLDCAGVRSVIFPLCAAYDGVLQCRGIAWRYAINKFYGSQAFVIAPEDAMAFIQWVDKNRPIPSKGFDILLQRWALSCGKTHFLSPYKSFVQHLGVESSMHNGRFHFYRTWPGTEWTYRSGVYPLKDQKNRPCDKGLAAEIAKFFGNGKPAYDLGCSIGLYVKELRARGIKARGFDGTPGIANDCVDEMDLARPQIMSEPKGNVMSLEVAEHIHPRDEAHFVENVTQLCADKLVISWAIPGQGGKGHVNEKAAQDVVALIEAQGFKYDHDTATILRVSAAKSWFKESIYAFARISPHLQSRNK